MAQFTRRYAMNQPANLLLNAVVRPVVVVGVRVFAP